MEKGLWAQLVDVMRVTTSISSLILDNVSATKDGIAALAEALIVYFLFLILFSISYNYVI